jgi:cytoskeletal protein RodZ
MKDMKTNTRFPRKKIAVITIGIVALILAATGTMALTRTGPFVESNKNPGTQEKSDVSADNHKSNNASKNTDTPSEKTPVENEPTESPTAPASLAASITAANQNGSTLQIRTLIETVSSDGTCKLMLTKGSGTHTYTTGIQAQSSTSTCKGFDIPTSDLSAGVWQATIDITIQGKKAHLTKNITVE